MIVTVTLNPALLVHYQATRVQVGAANAVRQIRYRPGGRGLAVARFLHTFGHEVVAAGLAGGSAGELIRSELARAAIPTQFTWIGAESRRVVQIADDLDGQLTSFAEPAPYITTEELGRLAADYRSLLDGATAVVLCGSLPDGLPAETYGSLVSYAACAGVPVVLDAGGSALHHGAARRPALIIPDLDAAGRQGPDRDAGAGQAGIAAAGDSSVVLLTRRGVRAVTAAGEWRAELGPAAGPAPSSAADPAAGSAADPTQPRTHRQSAFRDALVAGLVPGVALAWSWPDMLRHALALAVSSAPSGTADLTVYEAMLPAVQVSGPHR